ncbi:hypothetical protein [Oceanobacillus neutriphilus]|uniref:Uncharacterized protein n=1 Tax=Oceanobacillus neutriphilus TaxID=531815 RepID=A0ABQ2P258_9BACI|nr:hypothetical protein [Oceanobacillus neutriphilus]GGP16245.1 hypothetical protein GCM10011346_47450 [Oceanobacillus neutriphilus]
MDKQKIYELFGIILDTLYDLQKQDPELSQEEIDHDHMILETKIKEILNMN